MLFFVVAAPPGCTPDTFWVANVNYISPLTTITFPHRVSR